MSAEDLQKQFAYVQNEKYQRLSKMKKQKQENLQCNEISSSSSSSFGVSDDLNLSTNDVTASASVGLTAVLETANSAMMQEIRELKDENGRLRKTVAEKDYEIRRYDKKFVKLEEEKNIIANAGIAGNTASTKIIELSKKNRDLIAQLESEKSRTVRSSQKISELESKIYHMANGDNAAITSAATQVPQHIENANKVAELKDQLQAANLKVSEYRNQVQSLKQEVKIAHKVLSQEIGDDNLNLNQLLNNGGQGFRGRTQQVRALQAKIKDMELKMRGESSPRNDKNAAHIKNMEHARKQQIEDAKAVNIRLQQEIDDTIRKFDASKARNKVLAGEVKSLKAQITVLNDKGSHDNELIETLMKQQESLQRILERTSAKNDDVSKNEQQMTKELHDRCLRDAAEIQYLRQLLSASEMKVKQLEEEVLSTSFSCSSVNNVQSPVRHVSSPPPPTFEVVSPLPQDSQTIKISEHPSLIDTTAFEQEIQALKCKCSELQALYQTSETEREKLLQMIAVVNKRYNDCLTNSEKVASALTDEKKRSHLLKKQLESHTDRQTTSREPVLDDSQQVEDLQMQLSLQVDENNALKTTLEGTIRAKQDDVIMYQEMLHETKQVFLDTLRSFAKK